ncbi:MAG: NADPH-dependent assimilatory sulfite reductase hemoprotein subunit [Verrucomicrobia bacterium]|nr:NADPH-dependent assimilatory sulfite reductase hemoprotein subunit [Verrucomicrobiota bacterium]
MAGSKAEQIKEQSHYLRGTIQETLRSDASHFGEEDIQVLKFHGTYQQDDRDARAELRKAGLDKAWSFMVRTKIPGGHLAADQYLKLEQIATDLGNQTLRITTRQNFQYHLVLKGGLQECIARVTESGITTVGACGDIVRNVMASPSPLNTPAHCDAQKLADELTQALFPKTRAYAEIWLNGEKLHLSPEPENEPLYGKHYLPRKFKIGVVVPPRNDVDIFSHDIGYVAHAPNGQTEGYTILAGGGFGMAHGKLKTYPVLGKPLFYIAREHAVGAGVAIVTVQRDYGNREDRSRARMKYLIEERGIEWFRKEVEARLQAPTEHPKPLQLTTVSDMLGWHEQGDGKLFCGIFVPQGRIQDTGDVCYRSAFREIARQLGFPIRLTPNCNLLFFNIRPDQRKTVDQVIKQYGVPSDEGMTEARKTSHACVALPTCGLALAESERVFGQVMDEIDKILRELQLEKEPILIRMAGCPNGCSRPYNADISFVGRAPGKYAFFVGGSMTGDRLVGLEKKVVELKEIPAIVKTYLEEFVARREDGEIFSEYWGRTHRPGPRPVPEQFHLELAERTARLAAASQIGPLE